MMNLGCIYIKLVRQRQILYDFAYMWNLIKHNEILNKTKQKQTLDTQNKLTVTKGEGAGMMGKNTSNSC